MKIKTTQFELELIALLNKHSMENGSDTSDFILSKYLLSCLNAFNVAVNERENWYGRGKEAQQVKLEETKLLPCPNCGESDKICACMRNICKDCGKPVGNITFSVCDKCWVVDEVEEIFDTVTHKLRTEHYFIRNDKENRNRLIAYTQLIMNHMDFDNRYGTCYVIKSDEENNPYDVVDAKQIIVMIYYGDNKNNIRINKNIVLDLYEPKEFLNKKCNCHA